MKTFIVVLFVMILIACGKATSEESEKTMIVEAACGECMFGLEGKDCDLAVRIDGKAYFVDGAKIDDYGDPHAKDGFCESVDKAEIKGKIVNGRFKVSSFKLLAQKVEEK